MFTDARASQYQRKDGHLAYEYMLDYDSLRSKPKLQEGRNVVVRKGKAEEWTGVRVTLPANATWSSGGLCCHSAYELADRPDVAELVLVVCS